MARKLYRAYSRWSQPVICKGDGVNDCGHHKAQCDLLQTLMRYLGTIKMTARR